MQASRRAPRALFRHIAASLLLCASGVAASAAAPDSQPTLLVTAPTALQAVEAGGAGIARWFGDENRVPAGTGGLVPNDRLSQFPAWRSLVQPLRADIADIARRDRQAGVGVRGNAHRLFDLRWFDSGTAFFELVGVVNRLDRRPFQAEACGETRLVYRLAYREGALRSRLAMTVAVELRGDSPNADGSCRDAARRWHAPAGLDERRLGEWLISSDGPLAPTRLARERIAQVTVNLQSVRWPSAVRPDLGGHAEYLLRAFRWSAAGRRYEPRPLENTPDLARLRAQPALRDALLAWLREPANLRALDQGTLQVPERFLGFSAVSVAPGGLSRLANRPFTQLFAAQAWRPEAGNRTLGSAQAVLRRLDGLSCMGCHQSRSVAGFHLLGEDRAGVTRTFMAGNALALPHSPHLQDELIRRAAYLHASLSQARPDPFRPPAGSGGGQRGFGSACGLGDPGFAGWTCAKGLACQAHGSAADGGSVGVCMPERPGVGSICEPASVTLSADAWKDRAFRLPAANCGLSAVCERTSVGFPGGMCSGACDPLEPDSACGRIAILGDFNRCLAAKRPFEECLHKHTRAGQLRACSATQPCREDYICSQSEGQPAGHGACIPPYFLFQMRVDGHP